MENDNINKQKFRLSRNSIQKLAGMDVDLVDIVRFSIHFTKIDFGVICGLRTIKEQEKLVAKGASKTFKSKHLIGEAVDLVAYDGMFISWKLPLYSEIALAMAKSANLCRIQLRWGSAWHASITDCTNLAEIEQTKQDYIKLRHSEGKEPFIDAGHFEIIRNEHSYYRNL